MYQHQLESSLADKRHILVDAKLTVSKKLWERRSAAFLGSFGKSSDSRAREVTLLAQPW